MMQPMDPVSGRLNDSAAPSQDEAAVSLNLPVRKFPIIEDIKSGKINKAINKSQKNHLDIHIKNLHETHSCNHQNLYIERVKSPSFSFLHHQKNITITFTINLRSLFLPFLRLH